MVMSRAVAEQAKLWTNLSDEKRAEYGSDFYIESTNALNAVHAVMDDPNIIVNVLYTAVTQRYVKTRYAPGLQAKVLLFMSYMPSFVQDTFQAIASPVPDACKRRDVRRAN